MASDLAIRAEESSDGVLDHVRALASRLAAAGYDGAVVGRERVLALIPKVVSYDWLCD